MTTTRFVLISWTLIAAIVATAQRVPAQFAGPYRDWYGGSFNNPISAQMSTMLWNRVFIRIPKGTRGSTPSSTAPRSQAERSQKADESALRFRSSGTRLKTPALADQLGNTGRLHRHNAVGLRAGEASKQRGYGEATVSPSTSPLGNPIEVAQVCHNHADRNIFELPLKTTSHSDEDRVSPGGEQ